MSTPIEGSQPAAELSQQATPAHVELSQATTQATQAQAASATTTTTETSQTDVTALQAQLAQEQAQRQQAEQRFRDTQAAYTRQQQALHALSGGQTAPNDPNAQYIKALTDQGYNVDDAKAMVGVVAQMMAPAIQQSQQAAAIAQSTFLVDTTLQSAFQQAPQAFSTPGVQQIVHRQLQEDAARGIQIDPHYASALAKQAWYDVTHNQQAQQQSAFAQAQTVPVIRSMTGINGNFQGAQSTASQTVNRSAEQETLRGFLQSRIAGQRS